MSITLALLACASWGTADFLGGLKSRALPAISVLTIASIAGLALLIPVIILRGIFIPDHQIYLPAIAAGLLSTMALMALYRALAVGDMSIVAPISATGVILPVITGLAHGEKPHTLQWLGMILAVAGVILCSWKKAKKDGNKNHATSIGLALVAALFIGSFFMVMERASRSDPFWATMIMRTSQTFCLMLIAGATGAQIKVNRRHLPALFCIGMADTIGGCTFALSTTLGLLSIVSVIGSLYPAVTVGLAVLFLRERPRPRQIIGLILALAGVVFISSAV